MTTKKCHSTPKKFVKNFLDQKMQKYFFGSCARNLKRDFFAPKRWLRDFSMAPTETLVNRNHFLQGMNVLEAIGNTPLVTVTIGGQTLWTKLEFLNPSGSIKDRMAAFMIEDAEKRGLLNTGGTIIENSSGNTGAALAMIAAVRGYKCIITMPDKMSDEKQNLMKGYGARVIVTPTDVPPDSPESYYSVAKRLVKETQNSFYPDQYNNPKNSEAHYCSTGPEIWYQTNGTIDVLVAGIGTGGTISGTGKYLKERNPKVKVIGVDPEGSVFYDYFRYGKLITPHVYKIEGIGQDHLVNALDFNILDDIIQITDKEAFLTGRQLAQQGIFAGGSSGAVVSAALKVSKHHKGKKIIVILPDSGNRYLSKMYNDEWMKKNRFL